jgi:hypothetical protein
LEDDDELTMEQDFKELRLKIDELETKVENSEPGYGGNDLEECVTVLKKEKKNLKSII